MTQQAVPVDAHRLVREADQATGRLPEGMPAALAMFPTVRPLQLALLQFQVGAFDCHLDSWLRLQASHICPWAYTQRGGDGDSVHNRRDNCTDICVTAGLLGLSTMITHLTSANAARQFYQGAEHSCHSLCCALQELESQEDVLRLMPQALQLLCSCSAGEGEASAAGLSRWLAAELQHATLSGAMAVPALVPLQQLLWMLTASGDKVLLFRFNTRTPCRQNALTRSVDRELKGSGPVPSNAGTELPICYVMITRRTTHTSVPCP